MRPPKSERPGGHPGAATSADHDGTEDRRPAPIRQHRCAGVIAWTFEISQPANTRKGYVGDYGCWSAPAATEDAARKRVNAEVAQPYDDVRLVAGDLLTVSVDDRILWDNRGRRGEPILSPRQRSQAALRAIQRWRAGL